MSIFCQCRDFFFFDLFVCWLIFIGFALRSDAQAEQAKCKYSFTVVPFRYKLTQSLWLFNFLNNYCFDTALCAERAVFHCNKNHPSKEKKQQQQQQHADSSASPLDPEALQLAANPNSILARVHVHVKPPPLAADAVTGLVDAAVNFLLHAQAPTPHTTALCNLLAHLMYNLKSDPAYACGMSLPTSIAVKPFRLEAMLLRSTDEKAARLPSQYLQSLMAFEAMGTMGSLLSRAQKVITSSLSSLAKECPKEAMVVEEATKPDAAAEKRHVPGYPSFDTGEGDAKDWRPSSPHYVVEEGSNGHAQPPRKVGGDEVGLEKEEIANTQQRAGAAVEGLVEEEVVEELVESLDVDDLADARIGRGLESDEADEDMERAIRLSLSGNGEAHAIDLNPVPGENANANGDKAPPSPGDAAVDPEQDVSSVMDVDDEDLDEAMEASVGASKPAQSTACDDDSVEDNRERSDSENYQLLAEYLDYFEMVAHFDAPTGIPDAAQRGSREATATQHASTTGACHHHQGHAVFASSVVYRPARRALKRHNMNNIEKRIVLVENLPSVVPCDEGMAM
jgi:hypothetical protein